MPVVLEPSWTGRRVTVRRGVSRTPDGRVQFADVVGDLVGLGGDTAVVDTRDGLVEIDLATVAVAKLAPPSTADELALETIAADGWRAAETEWLGGWLLRATGGFTGPGGCCRARRSWSHHAPTASAATIRIARSQTRPARSATIRRTTGASAAASRSSSEMRRLRATSVAIIPRRSGGAYRRFVARRGVSGSRVYGEQARPPKAGP